MLRTASTADPRLSQVVCAASSTAVASPQQVMVSREDIQHVRTGQLMLVSALGEKFTAGARLYVDNQIISSGGYVQLDTALC